MCKDDALKPFGLYVHIPFCSRICPYCDFAVHPARSEAEISRYMTALKTELALHETLGWTSSRTLRTIFLGGGTPSIVDPALLRDLLRQIGQVFPAAPPEEVTLEINPETVTPERVRAWRGMGIDRASLGVQALGDAALKRLGRTHSGSQAKEAFQALRDGGFENVSVDLMFGLEDQTNEIWEETLSRVVDWKPDHISAYILTIEERTRYAVEVRRGTLKLPPEETQAEMILRTRDLLEKEGFHPYEISNFARPGKESRHNLIYWTGGDYFGIGMSAHSFKRTGARFERSWSARTLKEYVGPLLEGKPTQRETESLTREQHLGERLMTGLRLRHGVDLKELALEIDLPTTEIMINEFNRLKNSGFLNSENGRWTLTDRGILFSDSVFAAFQSPPPD